MSGFGSLALYGFVLGWSVAWPPGPINAEMVRRGLAHGFRRAIGVGLGACSGDALWAVAVALGAGLLVGPEARFVMALASAALLLLLAAVFLKGAWRGWRERSEAALERGPGRFQSVRGSYLLGVSMALTSPWNVAFWFAVIGHSANLRPGLAGAFVVAGSVILGAALWCLVLCTVTSRLRLTFGGPIWQTVAQGLTGLLMLGFAVRGIWSLALR